MLCVFAGLPVRLPFPLRSVGPCVRPSVSEVSFVQGICVCYGFCSPLFVCVSIYAEVATSILPYLRMGMFSYLSVGRGVFFSILLEQEFNLIAISYWLFIGDIGSLVG